MTLDEIYSSWLSGVVGPAYVVGTDMIRTIDRELGREAAVAIASDWRPFVQTYNEAARKARERGAAAPLFDDVLAARLAKFDTVS